MAIWRNKFPTDSVSVCDCKKADGWKYTTWGWNNLVYVKRINDTAKRKTAMIVLSLE